MSELIIPKREHLMAKLPIYCAILPLARPRMRWHVKGVYQPLENQKEFRDALMAYTPLAIAEPVIIDTYISVKAAKSCKLKYPTGRLHGDEDNLRKAINDGLVDRRIITDDKLVIGGENFKFFGPEESCLILIWSINKTETSKVAYV